MANQFILSALLFVSLVSTTPIYKSQPTKTTPKNIEICSFNKSYNSSTNKYRYVIEGRNKEEDYLFINSIGVVSDGNKIAQTKPSDKFYANIVVPSEHLFTTYFDSSLDLNESDVSFTGIEVVNIKDDIHYQGLSVEQPENNSSPFYSFNCEFDYVKESVKHYHDIDYDALVFMTYDSVDYCLYTSECPIIAKNRTTITIWDQTDIDSSKVIINNVLLISNEDDIDTRPKGDWAVATGIINVLKILFLVTIGSVLITVISLLIFFHIRKKRKKLVDKL